MQIIKTGALALLTILCATLSQAQQPANIRMAPPSQVNIRTTGFDLQWEAWKDADRVLQIGLTPELGQVLTALENQPVPVISLNGLEPGQIYWVRALAIRSGDTLQSEILPFATASFSSGVIEVYFSHAIEDNLPPGVQPAGTSYTAMLDAVLEKIDQAEQKIDVAMYNNNREDITNALKAAQARGVKVRYIAAAATQNYALQPPPPFPVLYGNSEALMHNKFLVIDPDLPDKAWVMSGSMNWTSSNITNDFNNLLFIQDQSLARAYQLEFEEMWGGAGELPVPANARFGAAKTNNTPHLFQIGGRLVYSWFSPSDQVTQRIVEALGGADHSADFALFSFTKNEIGDILVDIFDQNHIPVQGLIENTNDLGCEINYLNGNGLPVFGHSAPGNLHHKYGVVDAGFSNADPLVITGSHNWTQAAESVNDENTLIIHDAEIALLYKAEFNRRWSEIVNKAETVAESLNWRLYPNPATDIFWIENISATSRPLLAIQILDLTGRTLLTVTPATVDSHSVSIGFLSPGPYILKLVNPDGVLTLPIQKI